LTTIFIPELVGTALMMLLGVGVNANTTLPKAKGRSGGPLMANLAWGLAVMAGVYAAYKSGGHLNPAVTLANIVAGKHEFVAGVPVDAASTCCYVGGQLVGAFVGAVGGWLAYKQHFDEPVADPTAKLACFATVPAIRSFPHNFLTEFITTAVLAFWVLIRPGTSEATGPVATGLFIACVGLCLGGPTGWAINPARDLMPRLAHRLLPIKGKGPSDWSYSWIPIVAPLAGATVGALLVRWIGLP
jgi:glycerol uptake facilitator protein